MASETHTTREEFLRHQAVLLRLGAATEADFGAFLRRVLQADSGILGVDRVSFWTFEQAPPSIRCVSLYCASQDAFSGGTRFTAEDYPRYFHALSEDLIINAGDAIGDPRTSEFAEEYLKPYGIRSMLDVPVWCRGQLRGVVCHEHVGERRDWTREDQSFALAMAQFVSTGLERNEAQKVEQALRESEQRYQLLSRSAKDFSLLLLDPHGRIRAGAERILGFKPEELTDQPLSMLFPSPKKEGHRLERALRAAAETGAHREDCWLVRKDGSRYRAELTFTPLRSQNGELRGFASITQDLTEQELARENERLLARTRQAEERQRLLAEVTAVMNASLDVHRTLRPAARLICRRFSSACGVRVNDPHRSKHPILFAEARDPALKAQLEPLTAAMAEGETWGPLLTQVIAGGRPLLMPRMEDEDVERLAARTEDRTRLRGLGPVSLMIVPVTARRRVLGTVGFLRLPDEPRFDQDDLEQASELCRRMGFAVDNARLYALARESIRVRDQFLSVAAHEFRTPLTGLKLHLHFVDRLLRSAREDPSLAPGLRHVELATKQLGRLGSLVDELLESAHASAGRLTLRREAIDLSALVRDEAEVFVSEAARVGSVLTTSVDDAVIGRWDGERIAQVVTNLLTNAIRYGRGKPIELTLRANPVDAWVIVRDHGIGIAPEDQQRIFGRFERAADARHFGGLGLGLFIARRIVEAHHGTIEVTSAPGEGSTFVVRLPRWFDAAAREDVSFAEQGGREEQLPQ